MTIPNNNIEIISQYSSCQLWMDGLRSPSTKKAYTVHLLRFCKFYSTNPDQLLKVNSKDLKEMILNYVLNMRKTAKNSAGKPKRGQISVNSVKTYIKGIESFCNEHEISLPWKKISKYYPEDVTNEYRSYTRDEILKLLTVADLRDRCIILLMASSGVRVGAISNLNLKSLKKVDDGLGILTVYGKSKKSTYDTLVTPECMSTIEEYLTQRRKFGETLNDHSVLIRDKYPIYSKRVNIPMRLTPGTINNQMRLLVRRAVLPFEELQPDHAFRKFFDTALMNSDVHPQFKEMMMGHSIRLDDIYYDKKNAVSSNKLRLEYMKATDALTINDGFRLRKQIVDLEDKLKNTPKIERLQEQLANKIIEQDSMKQTLEKLQKEKELQNQYIKERKNESHENKKEIEIMREEVISVKSQMQEFITIIASSDESIRNSLAKQLVESQMFRPITEH
jgi:integrase